MQERNVALIATAAFTGILPFLIHIKKEVFGARRMRVAFPRKETHARLPRKIETIGGITVESRPWRTGIALAVTLAIAYTVCAAAYAVWPDGGVTFLNALFHGLDFRKLGAPATFTFGMFAYPLAVFVVWGFAVGTLYGWIDSWLDKP